MKSLLAFIFLHVTFSGLSQMYFADIGSDPAYCRTNGSQDPGGLVWASAVGGTAPITYSWENLGTGATWASTTWPNVTPGQYKITATDYYGSSISDTVAVDSINPVANFAASGTGLTGGGVIYYGIAPVTITFQNLSFGVVNPNYLPLDTIFYWQFTQFLPFTLVNGYDNQMFTYNYSGDWGVSLVAENDNGCSDTAYIQIFLDGPADFKNYESKKMLVFTADNQIIISSNNDFSSKTIKIFDIGGKMVEIRTISSKNESFLWNKGSGIFLYEIVNDLDGTIESSGKLFF